MKTIVPALIVLGVICVSCNELIPDAPASDTLLDGPVDGLTYEQSRLFLAGDAAFNDEVFSSGTGLGPIFVATSCGSCHAGDGKGHPFSTLTRFGQTDETGNHYMDRGGPQLQHRALHGFVAETLPDGIPFAKFTPPANTGLGFIELVSDADILAMADPDDADGDGISGRVNWIHIPNYVNPHADAQENNGRYIGRFGKKASVYNLLQQTVGAYRQDIGISSAFEPYDIYSGLETDPEVSTQTINHVVFYLQTLKAPIQRTPDNTDIVSGKQLFMGLGCEACHKSSLTSSSSSVAALSNKAFAPYTDLLLHDMGSQLDDGYTEGSATTAEWRTPALWGLGLSPITQGGGYFLMHDGRARSIEEAILMHGGEGAASKQRFESLSSSEKDKLIAFLKSL
ncbi:di-heme oxidoredictase family protein [Chryseolinea sp. T2]|uniref:di-heme oxidoredictase family protein n=1 Tax=Chryseolinea sp. T2 TaxID=3129255 RepID=UPI0030787DAC